MKQLFIILLIGITTSLTAQVYSDINITFVPYKNPAPSPGLSIGYNLNNTLGVGAFAQSQLGSNYYRSNYNITKENGVYYGIELKGNSGTNNNTGWTYKGRIGLGNYNYDSYYSEAVLKVNSYYEVFLAKNINRKLKIGLGWRQTTESTDVYEWGGLDGNGNILGVFDYISVDVYNDWFVRMAYTLGQPAKITAKKTKIATILNKLYLDLFVSKNLSPSSNNYYYSSRPLDQLDISLGLKITDDFGIGLSSFISNNLNTFIEEDLLPVISTRPESISERYYNYGAQGAIGLGLHLRATPGQWHYKAEVGSIIRIASNNNQFYEDIYLIDFAYYYDPINTNTDGFNPYLNLHVGRTFWDVITISAGYTFAPNINYSYEPYTDAEEVSSTVRYHAPQIKIGFTLD